MLFVIQVERGPGEGEEFSFENEARIGRTADNDLVVRDVEASRSHARIFTKGDACFVEDLGSANGTQLNGEDIVGPTALSPGDAIGIGDCVLRFDHAPEETPEPTVGGELEETSLKSPTSSMVAAESPRFDDQEGEQSEDSGIDEGEPPEERLGPSISAARGMPTAPRPGARSGGRPEGHPDSEAPSEPDEGGAASVAGTNEPAISRSSIPHLDLRRASQSERASMPSAGRNSSRSSPSRPAPGDTGPSGLSQTPSLGHPELGGPGARTRWQRLGSAGRWAVTGSLVLVLAAAVGAVAVALGPQRRVHRTEPELLVANGETIRDSFGEGKEVTFRSTDFKTFTFAVDAGSRVVGVLHFQGRDIEREEVSVVLNDHHLGSVDPDSLDVEGRELSLLLPASLLQAGKANSITFDNLNNPPGTERWQVWNLWLELVSIPSVSREEATRLASEALDRARQSLERRAAGAANLFHAWKTSRDVWLLLESTPDRPAELLHAAQSRMQELRPELDRQCSTLMLEVKKVMKQKPLDLHRARTMLRGVPTYFPGPEHPCHRFAAALLTELEEVTPGVEK